jgi:hypothetical protein
MTEVINTKVKKSYYNYSQYKPYYLNRYQEKKEELKQKYLENRDKLIEYSKNYYITHKDEISDKKQKAKYYTTRVMCDVCNCEQYENNMGRHILTKKHINNIYNANQNQNQNQTETETND